MSTVRRPAVAGLFYPAHARELGDAVEEYLREGERLLETAVPALPSRPVKAVVAPHAGYVYSGPVAGSAYALLRRRSPTARRVVLLGPAHRYPFRGVAAPSVEAFASPLGEVSLDGEGLRAALEVPGVVALEAAHEGEHSLEVHLPFLQAVLDDFTLVPLVVGDADPEEVAGVLEALWGAEETVVVVSTDLSHYLPYEAAVAVDRRTAAAVEALTPEEIDPHQACGRIPLAGLLLQARRAGLEARALDLRNSGDTAGPRDQVVGYGAFALA